MNGNEEEGVMAVVDALKHELTSRLSGVGLAKTHLSVRFEPGPRIVRLGACIDPYNWETRAAVLDRIIEFEDDHQEFALEFDIVPLPPVVDPEYTQH